MIHGWINIIWTNYVIVVDSCVLLLYYYNHSLNLVIKLIKLLIGFTIKLIRSRFLIEKYNICIVNEYSYWIEKKHNIILTNSHNCHNESEENVFIKYIQ